MHRHRIVHWLILFALLIGGALGPAAQSGAADTRPLPASVAAGAQLLSSGPDGVTFEIAVPWTQVTVLQAADGYVEVSLPGWPTTAQPGAPRLPMHAEALGVPFGVTLSVQVQPGPAHTLPLPAPVAPVPTETVQGDPEAAFGALPVLPRPDLALTEDPAIYAAAAPYPGPLAQVVGDAVLRHSAPRWMPDGSALVATVDRRPGVDDLFYYSDIVRIPIEGGEPVLLTGPDTADHNPRPSPDGQWIAYNSLPVAEYTTANAALKVIPASGGEPRVLTQELDAHPEEPRWLPDGTGLCFLVNERGRTDLRRVSVQGGAIQTLLSADRLILAYDLSSDGKQAGFVASTDRAPWDLYAAALDGSAERRLTEANGPWLASKALGEVEDLWFESADGTPIQGWIVRPPDFDPQRTYPLLLSIHGGPHVMWSRHEPTMWHEWQMQAARGYVVLACNPRGSDGYGRDFRATLRDRWGEADLPDLLAGMQQVIARGYVDPDRLVVTGGSYGGFMTAWVIGHDARFKAAVAQRGVYDLISFYGTSDIPLLTEWEFDVAPWQDPQKLWRYSPVAYADQIHTPLLLIHSENDYRAPIPAAEGLFVALRRLGREVEMVRFPRDGHELSRSGEPKHRVERLERIVGWFDRHLGKPEA